MMTLSLWQKPRAFAGWVDESRSNAAAFLTPAVVKSHGVGALSGRRESRVPIRKEALMDQEWNQEERIATEAAAWVERLRDANEGTLRTFDQWLTQDPQHVVEFLIAKVIAGEMRGLNAVRWRQVRRTTRSGFR
jgi:hypothetical protein